MTAEHRRLEEAREGTAPWRAWGPYLSERQWGTVREDYSDGRRRLGLLHPRPGPLARLSLGRGRPGRHLRRPAAALLRAGPVERQRPDPQGAAVRPDQQRGQPRRGRQGVLLLPRQHADALVHEVPLQVPAGGVSLRRPGRRRTAGAAATSSSTSCSTPASSTTTATSTSSSSTPRPRPRTSSFEITVAQPRPGRGRRCTCCRRCGSATPGRWRDAGRRADPAQVERAGTARSCAAHASRARRALPVLRGRRRRCCSPRTRPTRSGCSARRTRTPVRQGRHQRLRRARRRRTR